jgi:hypothetical protein
MAVGNEFDPATGQGLGTLAERWNGRTWQIVPTFKPAPAGGNAAFNGVACTSASACTAVGNQTLVKTLAERWNGHTWSVQGTPNPAGGLPVTLFGVACPARTVCTAVGLSSTGFPPLTVAERWSGGRWRIQPTPGLVAYDIGLSGVACPAVSACYAVGSYANNGPSVTLAEQWNPTGISAQAATSRPVAPGALPAACLRALPLQPLSASCQTPASDRRWPPAQPCLLQPAPRSQPGFAVIHASDQLGTPRERLMEPVWLAPDQRTPQGAPK